MKVKILFIAICIVILGANSFATTYDFPAGGGSIEGENSCTGSGPYLDLTITVYESASPCSDGWPGIYIYGVAHFQMSVYGNENGFTGNFTLEKTSGATFTANSVKFSPDCYSGQTTTVTIKAYNNSEALVGTYTKSGITGSQGSPSWTTVTFSELSGFQYADIKKLEFSAGKQDLMIDDLVMDDPSLPVTLSSFTAQVEGKTILLHWTTESETDNLGYTLERANGNDNWELLASYQTHTALQGHGNTSTTMVYTFTDANVTAGDEYRYRLSDVNTTGVVTMHSPISVTMTALPQSTAMLNAYPNPFNPETTVKYTLHKDAQVTITVYDLLGRKVKTLIDEQQAAGAYQVIWNGSGNDGSKNPSGTYIIRMETAEVTQTQKVLLLK